MANQTVSVTTVDNDIPGIAVTPTTLTVAEPSGSDTFIITLNTQPTGGHDVTIPISISGSAATLSTLPEINFSSNKRGIRLVGTPRNDVLTGTP